MQVTGRRLRWAGLAVAVGVPWTAIGHAGDQSPARATATKIARPTNAHSPYAFETGVARRHAGRSAVVHYVSRGPDAPPKSDRNRNGVPDYVEVVAAEADSALAFFANPLRCTETQCTDIGMPPFRSPRRDSAGPDRRPDIYLKAGLAGNGLTISPRRGEGGSFVLLAPRLELRRLSPRDGIYMILGHELFHLVEFAYVPHGAPAWISEGVANGMARRAWTASNLRAGVRPSTDLAANDQYDVWLDRPWLSMFSDELDCPRCYGTLNWWTEVAAEGDVLQRVFELMALAPSRIGLGVDALDQAIRERGPILDGRSLVDAMGAFWLKLFRLANPRPLHPLEVVAPERVVGPSTSSRATLPDRDISQVSRHTSCRSRCRVAPEASASRSRPTTDPSHARGSSSVPADSRSETAGSDGRSSPSALSRSRSTAGKGRLSSWRRGFSIPSNEPRFSS